MRSWRAAIRPEHGQQGQVCHVADWRGARAPTASASGSMSSFRVPQNRMSARADGSLTMSRGIRKVPDSRNVRSRSERKKTTATETRMEHASKPAPAMEALPSGSERAGCRVLWCRASVIPGETADPVAPQLGMHGPATGWSQERRRLKVAGAGESRLAEIGCGVPAAGNI